MISFKEGREHWTENKFGTRSFIISFLLAENFEYFFEACMVVFNNLHLQQKKE